MASRPAKRQRRAPVVLSDSDDDRPPRVDIALRTPKKQTQLELGSQNAQRLTFSPSQAKENPKKAASRKTSTTTSATSSPKKPRKGASKNDVDKNTRLSAFFSKATEEQRWHRRVATPEVDSNAGDEDDAIVDDDDDLSDGALLALETVKHDDTTKAVLDRRKISYTDLGTKKPTVAADRTLPPASQRFMKVGGPPKRPETGSGSARPHDDGDHHRPWADRYGPVNLDELAVHKKKIQDVQKWLDDALSGRHRQRMLLLKGPAGSGKTTTVSLLARALGFQAISWQNPVSYDAGGAGSVAAQFDDFLNRGGRFGNLSFEDEAQTLHSTGRPVLLVEEFPTSMVSSGLDSFRTSIQHFLARPIAIPAGHLRAQQSWAARPLVMIVSETLLSSSTAFSDSFTAHRLLGPEILNHGLVNVIEFNPVAPTFIGKALDLVIRKEARDSGRRRMPGRAVIQHLTEMGDVRNAVNTLEFLCIRNIDSDWSGTVASKTKKGRAGTSMTEMEKNSLQLLSQRETTLDMFHAAGKIVYNKRDDPSSKDGGLAERPPKPPEHAMEHHRPMVSQVDIDLLLNETGTDIQTFISTLHENYVLSCNGDSFVDSFEACAEALSISDILNPDSRQRQLRSRCGLNASAAVQANIAPTSSDALRQDEISFNVATRGLLFHLPYPVNRAAATAATAATTATTAASITSSGPLVLSSSNNARKSSDSFKMFYPAGLRLWRITEEIDSLIGLFAAGSLLPASKSTTTTAAATAAGPASTGVGGVATWQTPTFGGLHLPLDSSSSSSSSSGSQLLPLHRPSRDDLVLDILPYLARIRRGKNKQAGNADHDTDTAASTTTTSSLLDKIVRFNGSDILHQQHQHQHQHQHQQQDDEASEPSSFLSPSSSSSSSLLKRSTAGGGGAAAAGSWARKGQISNNQHAASPNNNSNNSNNSNNTNKKKTGVGENMDIDMDMAFDMGESLFLEDDDIVDD